MIIIPQSCPISASAQGMKALDLASPESCQTFAQSLTARGKHLRSQIWSRKWKTDRWMSHLSGRTWLHSHGDSFVESWVEECSRLVGPASPSVLPDNAKVPRMNAGCSTSSQMELWSFSLDSSLPKTWKDFCLQNSQTGAASLPIASRDWKGWVIQLRQDYSQRVKQGHPTDESACSSWPTASARDWKDTCGMSESGENPDGTERKRLDQLARAVFHDQRTGPVNPMRGQPVQGSSNTTGSHPAPSEWPTPSAAIASGGQTSRSGDRKEEMLPSAVQNWGTPRVTTNGGIGNKNTGRGSRLEDQVAGFWPTPLANAGAGAGPNLKGTPNLQTEVQNWRTPSDPSSRGGSQPAEKRKAGGHTINLEDQVHVANGRLSPRWVETLMGIPIGWTMPSCSAPLAIVVSTNSACSATESCPPPPPSHS